MTSPPPAPLRNDRLGNDHPPVKRRSVWHDTTIVSIVSMGLSNDHLSIKRRASAENTVQRPRTDQTVNHCWSLLKAGGGTPWSAYLAVPYSAGLWRSHQRCQGAGEAVLDPQLENTTEEGGSNGTMIHHRWRKGPMTKRVRVLGPVLT